MKVVIQRSKEAKVTVDGKVYGQINSGLVLLVGFSKEDNEIDYQKMAKKINGLRIFEDDNGKMNLSLHDVGGDILSISQFTIYGDTSKGYRPSFVDAMEYGKAEKYYLAFNDELRKYNIKVEEGLFGGDMKVSLTNDGPVTIIIDSKDL